MAIGSAGSPGSAAGSESIRFRRASISSSCCRVGQAGGWRDRRQALPLGVAAASDQLQPPTLTKTSSRNKPGVFHVSERFYFDGPLGPGDVTLEGPRSSSSGDSSADAR